MQTLCSEKEKCSSLVAELSSAIMKIMLFYFWGQILPFHSCYLLFLSLANDHPIHYHYCCMVLMEFIFFYRRSKLSSLLIKERTFCSRSPHRSCILQSRLYRIPTWLVKIIPLGLRDYESSDSSHGNPPIAWQIV